MPAKLVAERYELRELLGEGGMGFVYRALDTRTGGFVAIKTLRDTSDSRSLELFKREWNVMARLAHPNIVDIRDVDEIEENGVRKPCFVMPLLSGMTLAQLVKASSSRLTVARVVGILGQVTNGLEAAHKGGLIHRDLKPSNVFVMEDDTAKIIDFGLVHDAGLNSFAGFKGTLSYASPEQINDKPLTAQSDIYSLGVIGYEALTGRNPFKRPTQEATREAVRTHIPPALSELNPKVSQLVGKVIHKAMAKQPMHRYASAKEFGETLQKAYRNEPIQRFDPARILPRIERARNAFQREDCGFASEILGELEAEGNVDPEITLLRAQIEESTKQKRVRQLFEAAQSRLEQDEIPLAVDKLREILEIDPENAEAIAMRKRIEEQRSKEQISNWMKLARQHIETHDFQEARQAVQEILNIRYDDSEALHLLSEIDVLEKEATNARQEKEQLYGSALRAYQGGEISSALSKLERILDLSRRAPGATVPERDAVYQSFYNRVRTERDSIDKAYEDGRKYLNEKDFARALDICNHMLEGYPASAQFQALKLKIEQSERQELSSYIAEVARSVESEPDLERRVSVLEEACRRYPNEGQFQQSLRLAREQRDLVQSILAKARHYEETSQFADAIGQWKIVRNIHPQYPGIEFEIAQLEKRREQHSAEEKKARFIEQIDRFVANGAYSKAADLAAYALTEFPQDAELVILERMARQRLERTREAESLFDRARKARLDGRYDEATDLLQSALRLDEHNGGVRSALVSLLVERAHSLLDEDWRKAEPLVQSATDLDANHPAVKRLRTLLDDSRRKDAVTQYVADAREMQLAGDMRRALDLIGDGLSQYPDDPRLKQFQNKLQNTLSGQKPGDSPGGALPAAIPTVAPSPAAVGQAAAHSADDPFPRSMAEAQSIAFDTNSIADSMSRTGEAAAPSEASAPEKQPPHVLAKPATAPKGGRFAPVPARKIAVFGCVLAACILAIAIGWRHLRTPTLGPNPGGARPAAHTITVPINLTPQDATFTVNGVVRSERALTLDSSKRYEIAASRLGYVSLNRSDVAPNKNGWNLQLTPEPLRIQVITGDYSGQVLLDGKEIWNLHEGDLTGYEVPADGSRHNLSTHNQNGEIVSLDFEANTAALPKIQALTAKNVLVGASLGKDGAIYSADPGNVWLPGQVPAPMTPAGTALNLSGGDSDEVMLTVTDGNRTRNFGLVHGNEPSLSVLLSEDPNVGSLLLDASIPEAQVFVDGRERRASKPGHWRINGLKPGPHEIRAVAQNYADSNLAVEIEKGKATKQLIDFKPANAYLSITGGPADADVLVDGATAGKLASGGNIRIPLSPAMHTIEVKQDGYDNLPVKRTFAAGQTIEISSNDLVRPYGALTFDVTPASATVSYHRQGESDVHAGSAAGSLKLKAGAYVVSAEADKFVPGSTTVLVVSGESHTARLKLAAILALPTPTVDLWTWFQHRSDVRMDNGWFTGETKSVALKQASGYTITFLKPDRVPLKHKNKRIEWKIAVAPDLEVVYELDGQKLTRSIRGSSAGEGKSVSKVEAWNNDEAVVQVRLQDHRVVVSTAGAADAFTDDQHNWSHALVSLRGDQYFQVSAPR